MATIYEVATRAGVSPATVSRVFNGGSVSAAKAKSVRKAAEALNFTPNRAARTLRRRNSEVIALIVPDIENPYYTEMARGVGDRARELGYSVVLCNTDEDPDVEAEFLQIAMSESMAGVIIAPATWDSDLTPVLAAQRPVVTVDRMSRFDIDGVTIWHREAARLATNSLLEQGFRRIACITGPPEVETAVERAEGWRAAMAARGEVDPDLLIHSTFRIDGGRSAMRELLELAERPEAVVTTNNLMGVGALQVLSARGLVPPKIGVAIVGQLPFTAIAPEAITVVRLPARSIGETAVKILIDRIKGDDQPARTIVLQHSLDQSKQSADTRRLTGD